MDSNTATAAFFMLLPATPIVLVYLAGIIVALINANRHRKPAMFALAGFIALLVAAIIRAGSTVMTLPGYRGDLSIRDLGMRLAAINMVATAVTIGGTILILVAIFAGREKAASGRAAG